jgi:hypothetical protein
MAKIIPEVQANAAGTAPAQAPAPLAPAPLAPPWGSGQGPIVAPDGTAPAPVSTAAGSPADPAAPPVIGNQTRTSPDNAGDEDGNDPEGSLSNNAETQTGEDGELALLEASVEKARLDLEGSARQKEASDRDFAAKTKAFDELTLALEKRRPVRNVMHTIQDYHASQNRLAEERGQRITQLKSTGIDFKALLATVAPIDQAMKRKTGRGGKRPVKV